MQVIAVSNSDTNISLQKLCDLWLKEANQPIISNNDKKFITPEQNFAVYVSALI